MASMNDRTDRVADVLPIFVLFGFVTLILVVLLVNNLQTVETPEAEATAEVSAATPVVEEHHTTPTPASVALAAAGYDSQTVADGRTLYLASCSACHGPDARGVIGLGKNLLESEFVDGLTDEELREFIKVGRGINDPLNTTGMVMPPKGTNPALTDPQIHQIIAFIRTSADPALLVADTAVIGAPQVRVPAAVPEPFVPLDVSGLAVTSGSDTGESAGFDVAFAYAWSCSGCHGDLGQGVQDVGPGLLDNEWIVDEDSERLFEFIAQGSPLANPAEEFPHPARGAYPALTDDQIRALIDYLYSLKPDLFDPEVAYNWSCAGCHGIDGLGVVDVGPGLFDSPMVIDEDSQALFDFIASGRPPVSPEDEYPHPIRGEYPPLTDDQIRAVIDYLYTLKPGVVDPSVAQAGN